MLPHAALVQGAEGGAGPAHGAGGAGLVGTAVQQNQVLFTSGAAQSRHLAGGGGGGEHILVKLQFLLSRSDVLLVLHVGKTADELKCSVELQAESQWEEDRRPGGKLVPEPCAHVLRLTSSHCHTATAAPAEPSHYSTA